MPITSSHILSLFPSLFSYAALAPFFLRLALGFLFVRMAYRRTRREGGLQQEIITSIAWPMAFVEAVIGILLLIGLFTQAAALAALLFVIGSLWFYRRDQERRVILLLALAIALSILFLGAGALAFDLPI